MAFSPSFQVHKLLTKPIIHALQAPQTPAVAHTTQRQNIPLLYHSCNNLSQNTKSQQVVICGNISGFLRHFRLFLSAMLLSKAGCANLLIHWMLTVQESIDYSSLLPRNPAHQVNKVNAASDLRLPVSGLRPPGPSP